MGVEATGGAGRVAVLLAVLLVVPGIVAAVGPEEVVPEPFVHPSITIQGEGEFEGPFSGVREGSGTADDPYRIAGWAIVQNESHGILLENTRSHVVMENLQVATGGAWGIQLINATNVTVRDVVIDAQGTGIQALHVENLVFERSVLGHPSPTTFADGLFFGLDLLHVRGVKVANVTFGPAVAPLAFGDVEDGMIQDSTYQGVEDGPAGIPLTQVENVSFVRNDFSWVSFNANTFVRNFTLAWNDFGGSEVEVNFGDAMDIHHGIAICGNLFGPSTPLAIDLFTGKDVQLVGNEFRNGSSSISLAVDDALFKRNLVQDSELFGLFLRAADGIVAFNSFANNELGVSLIEDGTKIDATKNWWSHPSGPSGAGTGTGDAIKIVGDVKFDPWLTSAPETGPDAVECGVPRGPAGVQENPRLTVGAGLQVNEHIGPVHSKVRVGVGASIAP